MLPFLEHLATPGLDVRKELDKYGHENPQVRFNEIQSARRDIIQKKRASGFGGMMSKFNTMPQKPKSGEFDETQVFPSQFKNE